MLATAGGATVSPPRVITTTMAATTATATTTPAAISCQRDAGFSVNCARFCSRVWVCLWGEELPLAFLLRFRDFVDMSQPP